MNGKTTTASNVSLFGVPNTGLSPRSRFRAWRSTSSSPHIVLPRLALTAGPTLDITFSGRGGSPDLSYDEYITELGIQGGVLIYL